MHLDFCQLASSPLFAGIEKAQLPDLLSCLGSTQKQYKKQEIIVLESSLVRRAGLILSGTVHMVKEDAEGNQALLLTLQEGELLGESFSCGSSPDSCVSFLAASPCTVLFLPFPRLLSSCRRSCPFHHRLIENTVRLISDKNIRLMQKIEILSKKTLREKILAYLQQQAAARRCRQFTIPLGRLELAEYLCADRSALTRELSHMQKDGLISYNKNTFRLL